MNKLTAPRPLLVDSLSDSGFATTSWGEQARPRLRAIPYESPKLVAVAVAGEGGFADMLDQRLQRINKMKVINAEPERKVEEPKVEEGLKVAPMKVITDAAKPFSTMRRRV